MLLLMFTACLNQQSITVAICPGLSVGKMFPTKVFPIRVKVRVNFGQIMAQKCTFFVGLSLNQDLYAIVFDSILLLKLF